VTNAHQNNDISQEVIQFNTIKQIQTTYEWQRIFYAMQNNNQAAENRVLYSAI